MPRTHAVDALLRAMPREGLVLTAGEVLSISGLGPDTRMSVKIGDATLTNIPATSDGVIVGDQVWILRQGTFVLALIGGQHIPPALKIRGSVPTFADIPAGPHEHGDGWIVQDTGHIWVYYDPPGEFQDAGPFATTDHAALFNVGPDQHHAQEHAHDGIDGSGTVPHTKTTGKTENDHHPKSHGHTGFDGSGAVLHSNLSGVQPNDHHQQVHLLYGPDHSDVNEGPDLTPRLILAQPAGAPALWEPETRMNWRGSWIPGPTYYVHDVTVDSPWTMIANKTTTDRPAPQASGDPTSDLPDVPLFVDDQFIGTVYSAHEYTFTQPGWVNSLQIWVPEVTDDTHYRILVADVTDPDNHVIQTIDASSLSPDEWTTVAVNPTPVAVGTIWTVIVDAYNSGSSSSVTGGWRRDQNSQTGPPNAGGWVIDNQAVLLRIDKADLDSVDRTTELLGIVAGSTIQFVDTIEPLRSVTYSVDRDPTDPITHIEFVVTQVSIGPLGLPNVGDPSTMTADIPVYQSTKYVKVTDYWLTAQPAWATVTGRLRLGGIDQPLPNDAHGIRVEFQPAYVSEDWDFVASSEGGGSGGGDTPVSGLPIGGLTDQALTKIDGTDHNVHWSGPYLPLTSAVVDHADLANIGPDDHHVRYTDAEAVSAGDAHGFWDRTDLQAGAPAGGDRQIPVWDILTETWVASPQDTSLSIKGSVADFASLPPGPHTHGDAWVTNDTGDMWMWSTDEVPEGFKNIGPFVVTDHDALNNITPDDHHTRYTDAEAIAAVGDPGVGVYLPLAGGTMLGHLSMGGFAVVNAASYQGLTGADTVIRLPSGGTGMRFQDDVGRSRFYFAPNATGDIYLYNAAGAIVMRIRESTGQVYWLSEFAMFDNKITGLADPIAAQDAATKNYVDTNHPAVPPQTFLHADLTDITADDHHAELHVLDSHSDVQAALPTDGFRLAFDENLGAWVPKQSTSALGMVSFHYRFDIDVDGLPGSGYVGVNNIDHSLATELYIHEQNDDNDDISLFLDNIVTGTWINVYDDTDSDRFIAYDAIGPSVKNGSIYTVPVQFFSEGGLALTSNMRVSTLLRFTPADTGGGGASTHDELLDVRPDQHHAKYTDTEAINAVGPHFSGVHADLTGVGADDHHARYENTEAVAAGEAHGFWDRADLHPGVPGGGDRQIPVWDVTNEVWVASPQDSSLSIRGSVADFASLPPGPHAHGDAWVTNDTGDMWMWATDEVPEAFRNIGPFVVTDHDALANIGPDDHHTRYTDQEAIIAAGPHFSGVHGDLTGIGANDHHTRYTDAEAINANPPSLDHFVQSFAPASPQVGSVWTNPDQPPEATYLPLYGGTMAGPIDMGGNAITNVSLTGYLALTGGDMAGSIDLGGHTLHGAGDVYAAPGEDILFRDSDGNARMVIRNTVGQVGSLGGDFDIRNGSGATVLQWDDSANQFNLFGELNMNNGRVRSIPTTPAFSSDAVNQAYVDSMAKAGAWQYPALQNGWQNYGGAWCPARYRLDANNVLHIQGMIRNGNDAAGTNVFNLPSGYRPSYDMIANHRGQSGSARTNIRTTGNVDVEAGWATAWTFMDIKFALG